MTTPITHASVAHDGLAARFVAGTLAGDSLEKFEEHLLECAECQAEVRLGLQLRAVGRDALAGSGSRSVLSRRWFVPIAGIAAAAAVFLLMPARGDRAAMRALGSVAVAPIYLGVEVRSAESVDSTFDSAFDAAIATYQSQAWATASAQLRAVANRVDAGEGAAAAHFFAGAAALMHDDARAAENDFARVLTLPDSPYHDDARYYRAKALLRLGRADEARASLRAVQDPSLQPRASALVDSLEGIGSR